MDVRGQPVNRDRSLNRDSSNETGILGSTIRFENRQETMGSDTHEVANAEGEK